MKKKKSLDYIQSLEKAIQEKYGYEAVKHPGKDWDENKEKEYLEHSKAIAEKFEKASKKDEKIENDGFLVSKKLISNNADSQRECPVCKIYSFDVKDDLYMFKYECCFKCFVQWVEDREERWQSGWRPPN